MYPDRQTPPNTRNQSYLRRKGVVNHVPGLKRKGCPGTLKPLRLRRGRRAAACIERYYTGPFEGPPIIKPPDLAEDIYFRSLPTGGRVGFDPSMREGESSVPMKYVHAIALGVSMIYQNRIRRPN
jgi:hypothetical protein